MSLDYTLSISSSISATDIEDAAYIPVHGNLFSGDKEMRLQKCLQLNAML